MLKIRLKRLGRKKSPFYRIVVTDVRSRRDGAPLEELGFYNPLSKELKLNKEQALSWVSKGAQPTDTAKFLIDRASETGELIVLEIKKAEKLSKKAKSKAEAEKAAKADAEKAAKEAKEAAAAAAESEKAASAEAVVAEAVAPEAVPAE